MGWVDLSFKGGSQLTYEEEDFLRGKQWWDQDAGDIGRTDVGMVVPAVKGQSRSMSGYSWFLITRKTMINFFTDRPTFFSNNSTKNGRNIKHTRSNSKLRSQQSQFLHSIRWIEPKTKHSVRWTDPKTEHSVGWTDPKTGPSIRWTDPRLNTAPDGPTPRLNNQKKWHNQKRKKAMNIACCQPAINKDQAVKMSTNCLQVLQTKKATRFRPTYFTTH